MRRLLAALLLHGAAGILESLLNWRQHTMAFRGKPIDALTEADLRELVDGVSEGRTLDYKVKLPERKSRDETKEFLADVTGFANADGGHLLFGVDEAEGTA